MASTTILTAPVLQSTPVANTAGATFAGNYYKLAVPGLTDRQRKIIRLVSLVHLEAGYGSTINYRPANKHAQLITDASVFCRGISNIDPEVAATVNDWSAGYTFDTGLTTDIAAILLEGSDFAALPEKKLDAILAYLRAAAAV